MQSVSVIFAAAAVTVGLGIVASIGTFLWWRAHGASDVERLAFNVSDFLGEVIAQGGLSRDRYRTQDRLRVEAELGELGQHLRDRKLRKLVRVALEEYRMAGAAARPKPRVVTRARAGAPSGSDAQAAQYDAACHAFDAFDDVLTRVHELNRWTLTRADQLARMRGAA